MSEVRPQCQRVYHDLFNAAYLAYAPDTSCPSLSVRERFSGRAQAMSIWSKSVMSNSAGSHAFNEIGGDSAQASSSRQRNRLQ